MYKTMAMNISQEKKETWNESVLNDNASENLMVTKAMVEAIGEAMAAETGISYLTTNRKHLL